MKYCKPDTTRTLAQAIAEIKREQAMRLTVYKNMIQRRTITRDQANDRMLCMHKALQVLEQI